MPITVMQKQNLKGVLPVQIPFVIYSITQKPLIPLGREGCVCKQKPTITAYYTLEKTRKDPDCI